jgi:tetratricopeptide (TPR) repeat protein
MKRFLIGLLGSSRSSEATRHVVRMERRLEEAASGSLEEALLLNQAGDLALAAGDREKALRHYGQSVDAHMALRRFDAATAICRKVLRLLPDVVRARCTLAWLSVGKGLLDVAREEIDGYVEAAVRVGRGGMAAQHLRLMARYVQDRNFRIYLSRKLEALGDREGAESLVEGSSSRLPAEAVGWDPVVFATLLTPVELNQARERGLDLSPPHPGEEKDDFFLYWPPED